MRYYAHLDRLADGIRTRQHVARGALFGAVGNTGNAVNTPPHLHYGIYRSGTAINPAPLLRAPSDAGASG